MAFLPRCLFSGRRILTRAAVPDCSDFGNSAARIGWFIVAVRPPYICSTGSFPATPPMPTTSASRSTPAGARSESTIAVAPGQDVAVRMYGRRKTGETSPLVVHFHGGAFVSGDLDSGCTIAGLLQEAGALVVSVAYPLAPEHPFPQPLETGYAVLQWAYRYRTRLAGTGAPVYVAGEEAGGNLAAGVCLMARDQSHPPLAGQILVSPMLDPCVGTPSLRAATEGAEACRWALGWEKFLRCARDASTRMRCPAPRSGWRACRPRCCWSATPTPCTTRRWPMRHG